MILSFPHPFLLFPFRFPSDSWRCPRWLFVSSSMPSWPARMQTRPGRRPSIRWSANWTTRFPMSSNPQTVYKSSSTTDLRRRRKGDPEGRPLRKRFSETRFSKRTLLMRDLKWFYLEASGEMWWFWSAQLLKTNLPLQMFYKEKNIPLEGGRRLRVRHTRLLWMKSKTVEIEPCCTYRKLLFSFARNSSTPALHPPLEDEEDAGSGEN